MYSLMWISRSPSDRKRGFWTKPARASTRCSMIERIGLIGLEQLVPYEDRDPAALAPAVVQEAQQVLGRVLVDARPRDLDVGPELFPQHPVGLRVDTEEPLLPAGPEVGPVRLVPDVPDHVPAAVLARQVPDHRPPPLQVLPWRPAAVPVVLRIAPEVADHHVVQGAEPLGAIQRGAPQVAAPQPRLQRGDAGVRRRRGAEGVQEAVHRSARLDGLVQPDRHGGVRQWLGRARRRPARPRRPGNPPARAGTAAALAARGARAGRWQRRR